VADIAGVEMHERRAGGRVEADAAELQAQARETSIALPCMCSELRATPEERRRSMALVAGAR
jgi:hypothetical protein